MKTPVIRFALRFAASLAACAALSAASCKDNAVLEDVKKAVEEAEAESKQAVSGLSLSPTSAFLIKGQTCQLSAKIDPSDADNKSVTWKTSDSAVAAVSGSGLVTAIKAGSATITATSKDNASCTAACSVTVDRTIARVAGTLETAGYYGEGVSALSALLQRPMGMDFDSAGNLYFADSQNHCIRMVSTAGIISIVAGTHESPGYSGDTGLATSAQLDDPQDVAVDGSGNLYISDRDNNCIRMVTKATGFISTIAGGGLTTPYGIDIAGGYVYVADSGNDRIRRFPVGGGIWSDIVPSTSGIDSPQGVAVDGSGRVFIADYSNACIQMWNGTLTVVAGIMDSGGKTGDGGPATSALLNAPCDVAIGAGGEIFVADTGNSCIRVFTLGGSISTVAGTNGTAGASGDGGAATKATLRGPEAVAVDSAGALYIADRLNHCIRKAQ
jgi:sugar lactone lactonase YvrE